MEAAPAFPGLLVLRAAMVAPVGPVVWVALRVPVAVSLVRRARRVLMVMAVMVARPVTVAPVARVLTVRQATTVR